VYTVNLDENRLVNSIKLSTVLAQLDDKLDSRGNPKCFKVKFDSLTGERIYLHRAISVGLGKINLKEKAMRGFLPGITTRLVSGI
jgi:hypothetical protein